MKNIFYSNNTKLKLDDPVNDPLNDPVNDPLNQIIELLREDKKLSYDDLSYKLKKSKATVKRHIQKLKTLNLIKRVGSDKSGYWEIINRKGNEK